MKADVFLDAKYIGKIGKPDDFLENVKEGRRNGDLPDQLNVRFREDTNEIYLNLERGRARRPLIVVEDGEPQLTEDHLEKLEGGELDWNDLVEEGVIEYLDASEEENCLIALKPEELTEDHTHLEISPLILMGILTNMVPYPEHNASPRVQVGQKMSKQGVGLYSSNYLRRTDTDISMLHYPEEPIVDTKMYDVTNYSNHPIGQNVTIAVLCWEGYNMEDALVVNKDSLERGLFRATYFRPYSTEEMRYAGGQLDKIEIPDKEVRGYKKEELYRHLGEDGIVYPEAEIESGEILIGKTSPPRFLASMEELKIGVESRKDNSVAVRHGESGIVEDVYITVSEEGNKYVKVKTREQRVPEIGDKFASRHGQKGVIGMTVPQEDMPFTADGMVPDVIFNPQGIPSRMTLGHVIEMIAGKVGALDGRKVDGTPFLGESEENIREQLKELGFREDGTEILYDGRTGKKLKVRILTGSIYYLRLKHMVKDKLHTRSRGPVQLLTKQPTKGKAKQGGLRMGEMEKDCLVGHGASLALQERFSSDLYELPICEECGGLAVYNRYKKEAYCPVDGENVPIKFVKVSYAFKLLLDELKSLGIRPKLNLEPKGA